MKLREATAFATAEFMMVRNFIAGVSPEFLGSSADVVRIMRSQHELQQPN